MSNVGTVREYVIHEVQAPQHVFLGNIYIVLYVFSLGAFGFKVCFSIRR